MTCASIDRQALQDALAIASKVPPWVPPSSVVGGQAQGVIRIGASGGRARVTSANFNRAITVDLPAAGDNFGATVPLLPFERWIDKAKGGTIDLSADRVDQLTARSGRSTASFPSTGAHIPPLREPVGVPVSLGADTLRAGLEAVVAIPKEDAAQPYLGGVMIHGGPDGFGFVATDNARVHEIIASSAGGFTAILPNDTARLLLAILPNDTARLLLAILPNDTAPVAITADERAVAMAWGEIRVTSGLITGSYPATAAQFDIATPNTLIGRADELLADFDLVATVSDSRDRDFQMSLGLNPVASAFAANGDRGEVALAASWTGADVEITFAFRPVRDALQQFGSAEIAWQMNGPLDATIITAVARPDMRILVSPFLPKFQAERMAA